MAGQLSFLDNWLNEIHDKSIEVFLVHDIQDENTSDELHQLILDKNNPHIYLSEGKYGTAGVARNSVLNDCKGQWVTFWDSDDIPNVANAFNAIDDSFDVIIGAFLTRSPNGDQKLNTHGENQASSMTKMSFQPGIWRTLFKKNVISDIRFPSFKIGEDQGFLAQINWDNLRIKFSTSIFYTYNIGLDSQTTAPGKSRASLIESLKYLSKLIESKIGNEIFIRNLVSRQFLTAIRGTKSKLRLTTVGVFLNFFKGPRQAYRQLVSLIALISYLVRSE